MRILVIIYFLFFSITAFASDSKANSESDVRTAFNHYNALVQKGHVLEAIDCLSAILKATYPITELQRLAVHNNLGILYKNLGQYGIAQKHYDTAEAICEEDLLANSASLISIYGNRVNIYTIQGDYKKALEYTEKALRSVETCQASELFKHQSTASLLLNAAIAYTSLNDFEKAFPLFKESLALMERHQLPNKSIPYLQVAKAYAGKRDHLNAEKYYTLAIQQTEIENKTGTPEQANIFLSYGVYFISIQKSQKAAVYIQKALAINQKVLGERNQLTANCYQLMGDYYQNVGQYSNAISYYQKALISGSINFRNPDIAANPTKSEISLNLWQLRVLQRKAEVLTKYAEEQKNREEKLYALDVSLNAINLAMELTNSLRVDYQDEETRLLFSEKQKSIFVQAIETSLLRYKISGDDADLYTAYQAAQKSKANELKFEISRNQSFVDIGIPDTLRNEEKKLQQDISGYGALIRNEAMLPKPDTTKIAYWKDRQFELNRKLERHIEEIEKRFPRFTDYLKRGAILSLQSIQSHLNQNENLIEYVVSDIDGQKSRKLFVFVITSKDVSCHTATIDTTLTANITAIKDQLGTQFQRKNTIEGFNQFNNRLYTAYAALIQPIEKFFTGTNLIIIPDEELSYLPFDAFLSSNTKAARINYAALPYLIRKYTISYSYSTSTLWHNRVNKGFWPRVIGFAPDYSYLTTEKGDNYDELKSNSEEIKNLLNHFSGILYENQDATVTNFKKNLTQGAVLHLAMHSEVDTLHNGSSSLVFSRDKTDNGVYRLFNYEIAQMDIESPMVVLNACDTGNGKLYSGEGLMSIARNFIMAGVPSVVETLWPVEDISGSRIMKSYYTYLSDGYPKNEALRQAKLDYIQTTSPSFVSPGYWAAYTLMGNTDAIKWMWWKDPILVLPTILIILFIVGWLVYRSRRDRIS